MKAATTPHITLTEPKTKDMKTQDNNTTNEKTPKSRWHRWFFIGLYLLIVLALFGLFYNFVVRDDGGSASTDDGEETTRISKYDTLDVLGDYLWPGMRLDTSTEDDKDKDEEKDKKAETQQAAPVIEAEAATEADIEEATGLSSSDPATNTAPSEQGNGPKVEQLESPKVELIE